MRYPEQIICRAVSATPATARHLGFRLFPMIVPTSAELPFATYQRIGVTRLAALGNPVGIPTVSMSLISWRCLIVLLGRTTCMSGGRSPASSSSCAA